MIFTIVYVSVRIPSGGQYSIQNKVYLHHALLIVISGLFCAHGVSYLLWLIKACIPVFYMCIIIFHNAPSITIGKRYCGLYIFLASMLVCLLLSTFVTSGLFYVHYYLPIYIQGTCYIQWRRLWSPILNHICPVTKSICQYFM